MILGSLVAHHLQDQVGDQGQVHEGCQEMECRHHMMLILMSLVPWALQKKNTMRSIMSQNMGFQKRDLYQV
jgi:hypothetical protein